jgi:hypothetical protein
MLHFELERSNILLVTVDGPLEEAFAKFAEQIRPSRARWRGWSSGRHFRAGTDSGVYGV